MPILRPHEDSQFEIIPPNPDFVRLTGDIINQNKMILEMNAELLRLLQCGINQRIQFKNESMGE